MSAITNIEDFKKNMAIMEKKIGEGNAASGATCCQNGSTAACPDLSKLTYSVFLYCRMRCIFCAQNFMTQLRILSCIVDGLTTSW